MSLYRYDHGRLALVWFVCGDGNDKICEEEVKSDEKNIGTLGLTLCTDSTHVGYLGTGTWYVDNSTFEYISVHLTMSV